MPDDRIVDTATDTSYTVNEAIARSLVKFYHPANNFEFKYEHSSYIIGARLYLVNYVLDPTHPKRRKIGLKSAFARVIVDKENGHYFGHHAKRHGPLTLDAAIDKGLVSCEIVDLKSLHALVQSNILKYSTRARLSTPADCAVTHDVLRQAGVDYDAAKAYVISAVLDADFDCFVDFEQAKAYGLYDVDECEHVDSENGQTTPLFMAIRQGKIQVAEQPAPAPTAAAAAVTSPTTPAATSTAAAASTLATKLPISVAAVAGAPSMRSLAGHIDTSSQHTNSSSMSSNSSSSSSSSSSNSGSSGSGSGASVRRAIGQAEEATNAIVHELAQSDLLNSNGNAQNESFALAATDNNNNNNSSTTAAASEMRAHSTPQPSNEQAKLPPPASPISSKHFNLIKHLWYVTPSVSTAVAGEVQTPASVPVSFHQAVERRLYDVQSSTFKDPTSRKLLTIREALCRGVLSIAESRCIFDNSRVYVIDSVVSAAAAAAAAGRTMSLSEASRAGIVDKTRCVYVMMPVDAQSSSSSSISLKEAMQLELIRGKLITMCELRWMLNDYARRVSASSSKTPAAQLQQQQQQQPALPTTKTTTIQQRLTASVSSNHVE